MTNDKIEIQRNDGEIVKAKAPVIISASRSTDIPAFYSEWFINRLKAGYLKWTNPFNQQPLFVSFANTRLIVFWSKNPQPIFKHLDFIKSKIPNFYFQFTLNDYENDNLELNLPDLEKRIDTFIELSDKIGKEKVIWRFDPLFLTKDIDVCKLLRRLEYIGNKLKGHTNKLVFSFARISIYKKVERNLKQSSINYLEFNENFMFEFAKGLQELNNNWGLEIGACAEKLSFEEFNIKANKCIDDDLIIQLFRNDNVLMNYLGIQFNQPNLFNNNLEVLKTKNMKDKGQRELCGCVKSKDIGQYNTCPHGCLYCYANINKEKAQSNWRMHQKNKNSESIL